MLTNLSIFKLIYKLVMQIILLYRKHKEPLYEIVDQERTYEITEGADYDMLHGHQYLTIL